MTFYFVQVFSGQRWSNNVLSQTPFSPPPPFSKKKRRSPGKGFKVLSVCLKKKKKKKVGLGFFFFVEIVFLNTLSLRQKRLFLTLQVQIMLSKQLDDSSTDDHCTYNGFSDSKCQ